jgi:hypothetical protein
MRHVLAAAVLISGGLLCCGRAAPAATGPSTIRITDVQMSLHHVDASRRPDGAGDLEIVRLRLFNPSISSRPIGRGDLLCTYLDRATRSCTGTYSLPRGTLVVGGVVTTRLLYELAVVGGTGLYDNARGSLVATAKSLTPRHEVLVFRLGG